jgi:hypothetical protein
MPDRTGTFYELSESVHGYGAELQVSVGGTYYAIAAIKRITPGDATTADIDITHLRSPGAHREHRPGLRDHGAFTFEGVHSPGDLSQSQTGGSPFTGGGLHAFWKDRVVRDWKISLFDGSPNHEISFSGYVNQYQLGEIGPDDVINFTAGIMPTENWDMP